MTQLFTIFGWVCILCIGKSHGTKPHIIMIVADDLGWNDVSFHGSNQIPTPNIDKLAKSGIILNNYYVLPLCTPTRSAIMTGRYPIHTGMQKGTIYPVNTWGCGLNETFLPQYLQDQGYKTHAIGKWHLGFYAKEFTPTHRGFDSYYGYYNGKGDYWDHSCSSLYSGLDLHNDEMPVYTQWGNYSTEMFTAEAEDRIRDHNVSEPLFLYLAYQAVHSANKHNPLQAPQSWINKFKYIENEQRRIYAAMVAYMDYGVGRVYQALADQQMLDDSIIVFTTDNGGPANGLDQNWANNYPLRGMKRTLYEGGVRAAGFVYSKLLKMPGRVSMDLIHVTDWLPTFVNLAGGKIMKGNKLDGVDQWNTLQNMVPSPRKEILLNIVDTGRTKGAALRVDDWKIIQEGAYDDDWYPPPQVTRKPSLEQNKHFDSVASVQCGEVPKHITHCTKEHGYCLFNIKDDPCEHNDLSKKYPDILQHMLTQLNEYQISAVPSRNNDTVDPLSNPKLHNGVWEPWITLV